VAVFILLFTASQDELLSGKSAEYASPFIGLVTFVVIDAETTALVQLLKLPLSKLSANIMSAFATLMNIKHIETLSIATITKANNLSWCIIVCFAKNLHLKNNFLLNLYLQKITV
jgi:hypothetical protein